ncbi:MAG: N-acetylmuramic acid 6-phosphate etherase, partial [Terriglobales bacterium]
MVAAGGASASRPAGARQTIKKAGRRKEDAPKLQSRLLLCYRRNCRSESNLKNQAHTGRPPRELPATEAINPRTAALGRGTTLSTLRLLQREDAAVAPAVRRCLPQIALVLDQLAPRFEAGGRLIYVGAGSSGRLGVLDAAEIPPTFGLPPTRVVGVIAGGRRALTRSVEGAEDQPMQARRDLEKLKLRPDDTVVGLSAGGRAPYTIAALDYARRRGAFTVAIANLPGSALARAAAIAIEPHTGAEAIAGSTRLKAGSAQKMILNLISNGLMIRTGRVRGNLMVHLRPSNAKLRQRAERLVVSLAGLQGPKAGSRARAALRRTGGAVEEAALLA